jgi:polyhydroxybutyrate depolymerase
VGAVLAASCSSGSGGTVAASPSSDGTTSIPSTTSTVPDRSPGCDTGATDVGARGTHERVDLASSGSDRWYTRFVPDAYDGAPTPLVIDLHGYLSGAAGQAAMSDLGSTAEEAGFVVATPQGTSEMPYWNAVPHSELPDDIAFVEAVIDDVGASLCIDPARVYVDGFSNGAFLASLVACRLPDRVAAVAAVAGLLLPADCDPARPVPVLAIHGTDDRFVSFAGAPNPALADLTWNDQSRAAFDGLAFAEVTTTAARWAELDGCGPEPARAEVAAGVERIEYGGCAAGSTVQLYVIDGGGHTWPGSAFSAASASILGPTTEAIDANELIWSFFQDHPMP